MDLKIIEKEARHFLKDANGSHDWEHTRRVYTLARHIAECEGADIEIVSAAALLHDIGRALEFKSNGGPCHALIGAREAAPLLRSMGVPEADSERICHCIESHRYRSGPAPASLEAKVLFDADKLDSIGAVGIGRAFLFAGEVGAQLHDPDVDPETTESYSREDTAYREFLVKLRWIRDRMQTRTGRELAEERHEFMVAFFDRLNLEVQGLL